MGRLSLLAFLTVLALPVPAPAAILQNGRFAESTAGLPTGWRVEAWARDHTEVTWQPSGGEAGVVRIVNHGANDARLCQTVRVTPGASYRVTARVKTENIGMSTAGALIAIEPRIADSSDVKGTQDWQTLEVSAANPDQTTWDVCLRLGSYANLNTGTAWYTDAAVEQIAGPPPAQGGGGWSIPFASLVAAVRQTPWMQTALPLAAGLVLAFGLGIVGRRPD